MKKHWRCLKYILRHKWYVFIEACKLGIPIRGLLHDMSKFLPSEWFAYAEYWYSGNKSEAIEKAFKEAWLFHIRRNPHHWEFWVYPCKNGAQYKVYIPDKYLKEMVADWRGMSRTFGYPVSEALDFYNKHADTIQMSRSTKSRLLNILNEEGKQNE